MQVTIDDAESRLSDLIAVSRRGEEVTIVDGEGQMAKLVAMPRPKPFRYDILADHVRGPIPDLLEPLDEEELAPWEGRSDEQG